MPEHTARLSAAPHDTRLAKRELLFILTAVTAILFLRKADSLTNPQFWAEDGTIFFTQQYTEGAWAVIQPYAGYLHLVPRLIAFTSDALFPYAFAPFIYNYLSLAMTLLVVAGIYSPRFKVENKALMSLAVVAVNHPTNEVFLNITNLQWPLALLLLTVSLREQPEAQYGSVPLQILSDVAIILGCGLTGPFVIFIAPFFLWKWFRNRSRYNLAILLVVIAVAAIQTFFLASHPSRTSAEVATRYTLDPYARIVGQKFFGSLFFGVRHSYSTRPLISCGLLLATLSFIAWRLRNSTAWKTRAAAVFLTFATGVLLATMTAVTSDLLVLAPPDSAPRYVYLPSVLLLWSLIVCIDHAGIRRNAVVLSLLVLAAVSSWTSGFRSKALVDYAWKAHSSSIGKAESAVIPINPPGWFLRIPKKEF